MMAEEQCVKRITEAIQKHDIEIWNKWRLENPDVRPDLSGMDLKRADLKTALLRGAILKEANLRGADLSRADLRGAELQKANLVLSHLGGANLSEADLSGANLCDADLSEANLSEANFSGADLVGALLQGADLSRAKLADTVKNLSAFQIKTARNWEHALYGAEFREHLGLQLDTDETPQNEKAQQKAET